MRTKILMALAAVSCIALNTPVSAQENAGGYTGPVAVEVISVEQAKALNDDANVTLRGTIQQNTEDEIYIFTDNTGSINVEIDDDVWNGIQATPQDIVEISGEVDKSGSQVEIDVEQISKIAQ